MNHVSRSEAGECAPKMAGLRNRQAQIVLYAAGVFLYWASLYLYVPTLPIYAQSKSDNLSMVGVAISMYGLWQIIVRLPLGIAADWLGRRKPFIVAGYLLAGLGALIMGRAEDIYGLMLGRSITGLAAAMWAPLVVVFCSLYRPEEAVRASAILVLVNSASRMLATGVTGTLNASVGYEGTFLVAAGLAVLALLLAWPAQEQHYPSRRPSWASVSSLISRKDVLFPALLNVVVHYAGWATTFGFLPILAKQMGGSDSTISLLVSMSIGLIALGNLATTVIVDRIGTRRLITFGFILLWIGITASALAPSVAWLFAAQICVGIGTGINYPMLMGMSIQHVAGEKRATAMGLHQAVYAIGLFAGPSLSGVLADAVGIRPMFGITAFLCLMVGLLGTRLLIQSAP